MNFEQTVEYLFSRLPMFQRDGSVAYKKDLCNTLELCKHLGDPHKKFKSVHIAGTNGKGSTAHMLASIFQEAGYKTGLYTSPHLKDFRERIKINGKMISKKAVVGFVSRNKEVFEEIKPSFFECTVALAFDYFASEKVDIAIIETGMGGRLDSTNVLSPELSIITNIGFDHMHYLGSTKEEIAFEKAGIVKPKVPLVVGERSGVEAVFANSAEKNGSEIIFAEDIHAPKDLRSGLAGIYQAKNMKTVFASFQQLKNQWKLNEDHLYNGCQNVVFNTGLRGRWDILSKEPLIIADTAHNEDGIRVAVEQLNQLKHEQLHIVLGMVNDKDHSRILPLFPKDAVYYFCAAKIMRALSSEELRDKAEKFNLKGEAYASVAEAFESAKASAGKKDVVFIGGSTFTVAEVI